MATGSSSTTQLQMPCRIDSRLSPCNASREIRTRISVSLQLLVAWSWMMGSGRDSTSASVDHHSGSVHAKTRDSWLRFAACVAKPTSAGTWMPGFRCYLAGIVASTALDSGVRLYRSITSPIASLQTSQNASLRSNIRHCSSGR